MKTEKITCPTCKAVFEIPQVDWYNNWRGPCPECGQGLHAFPEETVYTKVEQDDVYTKRGKKP